MEKTDIQPLNSVTLRGIIGSFTIKDFGTRKCCRMSVCTDYAYLDKDGLPVVETTWHQCVAWEDTVGGDAFNGLKKYAAVEIEGRLRGIHFTDCSGKEQHTWEIVAASLNVIADQARFAMPDYKTDAA